MTITFNKSDFLKFFNMISVFKTYAELADKMEIEPPQSAIDLLLYKLADLIIENDWYETTIEDQNLCFAIIQFMLGTAKIQADEEVANSFNIQGQLLTINIEALWNYLLENGIEI